MQDILTIRFKLQIAPAINKYNGNAESRCSFNIITAGTAMPVVDPLLYPSSKKQIIQESHTKPQEK